MKLRVFTQNCYSSTVHVHPPLPPHPSPLLLRTFAGCKFHVSGFCGFDERIGDDHGSVHKVTPVPENTGGIRGEIGRRGKNAEL